MPKRKGEKLEKNEEHKKPKTAQIVEIDEKGNEIPLEKFVPETTSSKLIDEVSKIKEEEKRRKSIKHSRESQKLQEKQSNNNIENIIKNPNQLNYFIKVLWEEKLDDLINQSPQYINIKSENNDNLLALFIMESNAKAVQKLLENGADLFSANNEGKSPLILAIESNNYKVMKVIARYLAEKDIINNSIDDIENTPLHYAAENNHDASLFCLLREGGDPSIKNNYDDNAFELAISSIYRDCARILLFHPELSKDIKELYDDNMYYYALALIMKGNEHSLNSEELEKVFNMELQDAIINNDQQNINKIFGYMLENNITLNLDHSIPNNIDGLIYFTNLCLNSDQKDEISITWAGQILKEINLNLSISKKQKADLKNILNSLVDMSIYNNEFEFYDEDASRGISPILILAIEYREYDILEKLLQSNYTDKEIKTITKKDILEYAYFRNDEKSINLIKKYAPELIKTNSPKSHEDKILEQRRNKSRDEGRY